jgi:hypothetical protein
MGQMLMIQRPKKNKYTGHQTAFSNGHTPTLSGKLFMAPKVHILYNHWTKWSQTLQRWSLEGPYQVFILWCRSVNKHGRKVMAKAHMTLRIRWAKKDIWDKCWWYNDPKKINTQVTKQPLAMGTHRHSLASFLWPPKIEHGRQLRT